MVFLTGVYPLPADHGVTVYLARSDAGPESYTHIGNLVAETPSALFKVPAEFLTLSEQGVNVQLGISLEPLTTVLNLGQPEVVTAQSRAQTFFRIARKIADDLHMNILSYAQMVRIPKFNDQTGIMVEQEVCYVPTDALNKWRQRLETKISKDNLFWTS